MVASTVLYQRDGRIARITLNRPEKLTALGSDGGRRSDEREYRLRHESLAQPQAGDLQDPRLRRGGWERHRALLRPDSAMIDVPAASRQPRRVKPDRCGQRQNAGMLAPGHCLG